MGVGQGSDQPGDVIGRRKAKGSGQGGETGSDPGEEYIESEMEIEELVAMMLEDLGLPNLEKKEATELEVSLGFKINGINKSGPKVLMDPRRSCRTPFGRFYAFLQMLEDETGREELTCYSALKASNGEFGGALALLEDPDYESSEDEVELFGIYTQDDLRFHKVREDVQQVSNAVIMAIMDVSGSMTTMKKYLARSVLFWLVEFLRTIYAKVEIRFIVHHANARLVPEEEFFPPPRAAAPGVPALTNSPPAWLTASTPPTCGTFTLFISPTARTGSPRILCRRSASCSAGASACSGTAKSI